MNNFSIECVISSVVEYNYSVLIHKSSTSRFMSVTLRLFYNIKKTNHLTPPFQYGYSNVNLHKYETPHFPFCTMMKMSRAFIYSTI